jgi:hypothetical protein
MVGLRLFLAEGWTMARRGASVAALHNPAGILF